LPGTREYPAEARKLAAELILGIPEGRVPRGVEEDEYRGLSRGECPALPEACPPEGHRVRRRAGRVRVARRWVALVGYRPAESLKRRFAE
jgi:hypothetical protein